MLPLSCWKGREVQLRMQLDPTAGLPGVGAPEPPQCSSLLSPDATTYAHFLFNAFDADGNGAIHFEVGPP